MSLSQEPTQEQLDAQFAVLSDLKKEKEIEFDQAAASLIKLQQDADSAEAAVRKKESFVDMLDAEEDPDLQYLDGAFDALLLSQQLQLTLLTRVEEAAHRKSQIAHEKVHIINRMMANRNLQKTLRGN